MSQKIFLDRFSNLLQSTHVWSKSLNKENTMYAHMCMVSMYVYGRCVIHPLNAYSSHDFQWDQLSPPHSSNVHVNCMICTGKCLFENIRNMDWLVFRALIISYEKPWADDSWHTAILGLHLVTINSLTPVVFIQKQTRREGCYFLFWNKLELGHSPITQNGFLAKRSLPCHPRYRQQHPADQIRIINSKPKTTIMTNS